jgi:hypothetical protein
MSYFEHYYNLAGEKTLRTYSRPLNLASVDDMGWMTAEEDLWPLNHPRLYQAGKTGMVYE